MIMDDHLSKLTKQHVAKLTNKTNFVRPILKFHFLWKRLCVTLIAVGLCHLFIHSSFTFAMNSETNWMAEFVRLRVLERNLKAFPSLSTGVPEADFQRMFSPRIVGGTIAGADDNPFQVALLWADEADDFIALFCGGTLINENFVVTAAHCSDFVTEDQVQVLTGTNRLDGTGDRRDVASITIHKKWNSETFDNDVAVWELSSSATDLPLASLATEDGTDGAVLLTTGWGLLSEGGLRPTDLQRVEVPLVDRENCNDDNSYRGAITGNMICAGLDEGGKDSCQGDSGGPLTRGNENSILTGITSWGLGCAQKDLFGVYTRVSASGIRNFIQETIRSKFWQPDYNIPDQTSKASPALAMYQGKLHMVHLGRESSQIYHSTFDGSRWTEDVIPEQTSKASPALAVYQEKLHMVHLGRESSKIYHSTFDGSRWTEDAIPKQTSKASPALAMYQGKLHMVHLGRESSQIYHSTFDGSRWTEDVIPEQTSKASPALAVYQEKLHMVHLGRESSKIYHSTFDGSRWTEDFAIQDQTSKASPALAMFEERLHMVHLGRSSNKIWHSKTAY